MKKKALITGITGQDGSYLAEFLLKKNYIVHGIKRKSSSFNTSRIDHIFENPKYKSKFFLHYGDLTDSDSIFRIINKVRPNEIYNLGAQSHVGVSFETPLYTAEVSGLGSLRILEIIRFLKLKTKFYQATTSELFGERGKRSKFNEKSEFNPKSPYGVSKLFSHFITKIYRESYGIYASSGILFNHESPRRGETFVTRKITRGLTRIDAGLENCIYMGNLDAKRDWGHARDYVKMQWLMLQQEEPDDFVISTGRMETVRKFIEICAKKLNWNKSPNEEGIIWEGEGINEVGIKANSGKIVIKVDPRYFRPTEVDQLLGDSSKAYNKLGWKPETTLEQLIEEMIVSDKKKASEESFILKKGFQKKFPMESPPNYKRK